MTTCVQRAILTIAFAAGLASTLASTDAAAVERRRSFVQNATGACQAALPNFEGNIRKRPLAIQNEGSGNAFISCSLVGTDRSLAGLDNVYLYLTNSNDVPVNVTCTLIDGYAGRSPAFITKSRSVPANEATSFSPLNWTSDDNDGDTFSDLVNTSCNLPPGTGITVLFVYYDEDVGA